MIKRYVLFYAIIFTISNIASMENDEQPEPLFSLNKLSMQEDSGNFLRLQKRIFENQLFTDTVEKGVEKYRSSMTDRSNTVDLFKKIHQDYLKERDYYVESFFLSFVSTIKALYNLSTTQETYSLARSMVVNRNDIHEDARRTNLMISLHKNKSLFIAVQLYLSSIPLIVHGNTYHSVHSNVIEDLTHNRYDNPFTPQESEAIYSTLQRKNEEMAQKDNQFKWLADIDCRSNIVNTKFNKNLFLYKIFLSKVMASIDDYHLEYRDLNQSADNITQAIKETIDEHYDLYFPSFFDLTALIKKYGVGVTQPRDMTLIHDDQLPADLRLIAIEPPHKGEEYYDIIDRLFEKKDPESFSRLSFFQ